MSEERKKQMAADYFRRREMLDRLTGQLFDLAEQLEELLIGDGDDDEEEADRDEVDADFLDNLSTFAAEVQAFRIGEGFD